MLNYCLYLQDSAAKAHTFDVSLTIDAPAAKQLVSLPVWIPGSYLVREFSKHLFNLNAKQGGKDLVVTQVNKCTWGIDCDPHGGMLKLSWRIYGFDTSVRMAYLDQTRGFVNGTSVFLRPHGLEDQPVLLTIIGKGSLVRNWSVACALPPIKGATDGLGVFQANNYDELVDSPIQMGAFWRGSFKASGIAHEFVVLGAPAGFDGNRLLKDTQKICEHEIAFWHGQGKKPPFKQYVFILNVLKNGYGGLEHCASSALVCSHEDLPLKGASLDVKDTPLAYQTLLGLISHEYFHAWNVKRMRPSEFAHYDYSQENYTEMLWFFEGFTSYYDDIFLLRSGLVTQAQYLEMLAKNIISIESMPGKEHHSVAQASFEAWTKYYRVDENTPNMTVSYYTKGALVALCLDLTLRKEGHGSLDDVMRWLWKNSRGGPIAQADVEKALKQVGGRSYTDELAAWVHSCDDLPVEQLLALAGVDTQRNDASLEEQLGMRVTQTPSGLVVKTVFNNSAAQRAGLAARDELIAVNGYRITDLKQWDTYVPQGACATVLFAREHLLMQETLQPDMDKLGKPRLHMRTQAERRKVKTEGLKNWPEL